VRRWQLLKTNARHDRIVAEARALWRDRYARDRADSNESTTVRTVIGCALNDLGCASEALAELDAMLAAKGRVRGPEARETLGIRHERARALAALDRAPEALAEFDAVLAAEERVLGPEAHETLATRHERARCLFSLGRTAEATGEFDAIIARRVRDPADRGCG